MKRIRLYVGAWLLAVGFRILPRENHGKASFLIFMRYCNDL